MLYLIHDEKGEIKQSNKHYSPEGYDKVLSDRGYTFIKVDHPKVLMPDEFFIKNGAVQPRASMPVVIDKKQFKMGSGATLSNIPKAARLVISILGMEVQVQTINDGQAYIESPSPGLFKVTLESFPYLLWTCDLECVE